MVYDRCTNGGWNRRRKVFTVPLPPLPLQVILPQYQVALSVLAGFLIGLVATDLAHGLSSDSPTPSHTPPSKVGADTDPDIQGAPQGRPPRHS